MSAATRWACPKCGATDTEHGKGGAGECVRPDGHGRCGGFLCRCEGEGAAAHGTTVADPCPNARCYHCKWGGTFPVPPKRAAPWEKNALAAGWTPPRGWRAGT